MGRGMKGVGAAAALAGRPPKEPCSAVQCRRGTTGPWEGGRRSLSLRLPLPKAGPLPPRPPHRQVALGVVSQLVAAVVQVLSQLAAGGHVARHKPAHWRGEGRMVPSVLGTRAAAQGGPGGMGWVRRPLGQKVSPPGAGRCLPRRRKRARALTWWQPGGSRPGWRGRR